jgi:hypothetical protein
MRLFKFCFISLFIIMSLVVFSGCQKDPVAPSSNQTESAGQSKESTSGKTNSKDGQATQKAQSEKEKSEDSKTKTSEAGKAGQDSTKTDKNAQTSVSNKTNNTQTSAGSKSENVAMNSGTSPKTSKGKNTSKASEQKSGKGADTTSQNSGSSSQTSKNTQTQPKPANKTQTEQSSVSIAILGDKQKGTILSSSEVGIKKDDTVLSITISLLKQKGIQYSIRGSGATAYVEGIDNLYEFDDGPLSGWNVMLNGKLLSESAGAAKLTNGDHIVWSYTSDYKKDGQG